MQVRKQGGPSLETTRPPSNGLREQWMAADKRLSRPVFSSAGFHQLAFLDTSSHKRLTQGDGALNGNNEAPFCLGAGQ